MTLILVLPITMYENHEHVTPNKSNLFIFEDSLGEYQAVKVQESHKKGPSGNPQIVGKTSLKTSGSAGQLSENVQHRRSRFEVSK